MHPKQLGHVPATGQSIGGEANVEEFGGQSCWALGAHADDQNLCLWEADSLGSGGGWNWRGCAEYVPTSSISQVSTCIQLFKLIRALSPYTLVSGLVNDHLLNLRSTTDTCHS